MELNTLKIFHAVASEGSVSRAAQKLNYVQPNVTARIQQLEEELGTVLFYRKPRGMAISSAGKTLLKHCEKIFKTVSEAQEAVSTSNVLNGTFSIGCTTAFASYDLPPVIASYHDKYPGVQIIISTMVSEKLIAAVLGYELDCAFLNGTVNNTQLISDTVYEDELVLVTSKKYPTMESLTHNTALVFNQGCTFRASLEFWMRKQGFIPYEISEIGSLNAIIGCVAGGIGFTMLPKSIVARSSYAKMLQTHAIPSEIAYSPIVFIQRGNISRSNAMESFLRQLKETASVVKN